MTAAWSWVEAAVLAGAALGVLRIAIRPPVRRELRLYPLLAIAVLIGMLLALALLAWLSTRGVAAQGVLTGAVVLATGLAWYRARPAFGARRELPPGSLGLHASLRAVEHDDFYAEAFRRWGSVFKMSQFHRPVVCIADLRLAREFLQQQGGAVRQVDWPFNRLLPGKYVEFMDGALHAHYRAVFEPGFRPELLRGWVPELREMSRSSVREMCLASAGEGVAPFAWTERLAYRALLRILMGVDAAEPRAANLPALLAVLNRPIHPWLPLPAASRRAITELMSRLREVATDPAFSESIAARRSVFGEMMRQDPAVAGDDVVIGHLATMLHDGRNMLRMLLDWLVKCAADHLACLARIRAAGSDEAAAAARADEFVLEVLRTNMTPYIYRKVNADCRLGPYRIPRGWLVRICLREAHHSPRAFDRPHEFDPSRFGQGRRKPDDFWPFSIGAHACFAEHFVMAVASGFVQELAAHDLRALSDGAVERHNRHWAYAVPSRQLRVRLTPATVARQQKVSEPVRSINR